MPVSRIGSIWIGQISYPLICGRICQEETPLGLGTFRAIAKHLGGRRTAVIHCHEEPICGVRRPGRILAGVPSFVEAIVNRTVPVDRKIVHYWPQYAEDFYRPIKPKPIEGIDPDDGCYKIAFTGNIGTAQGLDIPPKQLFC